VTVVERLAYLALVALFALVVPFARLPNVTFAGFRESMLLSSSIVAAATAVVLVALWRAKPRSAFLVLAQAYLIAAVAAFGPLFALPPIGPDGARAGGYTPLPYVYLAWHITFAIVACVYVILRRRTRGRRGPRPARGWFVPFVLPAGFSLTFIGLSGVLAHWFPLFVGGQRFVNGPILYVDIGATLLAMAGCVALLRLPRRNYVDATLGLTLAAMALELALNLVTTEPYSLGWSVARATMFASLAFVLVGTGAELIATYRNAFVWRERLRVESERSNERSRRMEALWALARDPARDEQRLDRIISEGVRALSGANGNVSGRLGPIDEIVRDGDAELLAVRENEPTVRVSAHPQPAVSASFAVERTTYVLHFTRESDGGGFDADDLLFVQVLSTLCAEILEETARRRRLQFQAEREMLTGLYNPTVMRSRLVAALREGPGAFLTIRVANLRDIGRSLGRLATDAILVEIAALLAGVAAPGEIVARAGDDSFGVIFPGATRAAIDDRIAAYAAVVDRAFDLGDRSGRASVDVIPRLRAIVFEAGDDAEAVLTQASFDDESGLSIERVKIVPYDREHNHRYAQRRDLLAELRAGIERGEITAFYQPYVDLETGAVVGAEALMRWIHPQRGLMEPGRFMSLAQQWGLMPALGESVADRVFADIGRLRAGQPDFHVFINLDAAGFEASGLVERLLERARRAGVPPDAIGVEITETTAMRDVAAAQAVMESLHRAGIAIALDDFGTGFSSLAYLKQYPVDVIKIDRTFVAGLPQNPFDTALVGAIVAVADAFAMRVHAEGIETPEQAAWLRSIGCTTAQGYYYARPLPLEEFVAYTAIRGAGISAGRT
jgi:EAL domain-containing protein (putative c-di-GMP-specific phosphodiesterase class I)/GGDEF domain-containing protein